MRGTRESWLPRGGPALLPTFQDNLRRGFGITEFAIKV